MNDERKEQLQRELITRLRNVAQEAYTQGFIDGLDAIGRSVAFVLNAEGECDEFKAVLALIAGLRECIEEDAGKDNPPENSSTNLH